MMMSSLKSSHCRVQDIPRWFLQAMDFVNEQHVAGFEVCQQASESPAFSMVGPLVL